MDLFRQILMDAKEHSCRLVVIIAPGHATHLGIFPLEGDSDPTFRCDREVLTRLVAGSNRA
ncbi:MAG: hypothetical protein MUF31_09820 [Akkermansiaceae bacterium]|jgi:hypothetical protein|nr:hypothetical protein [Akkermansiaceae bacterium]